MSALISDNTTLLRYIPNTLKAVAGETSLYDKIQYHLLHAETWLTDTFVSTDTMSRIKTYSDITPLLHFCRIIVTAEAMLHAIPQLDLILTPNGFGIVSNQNIAPASKERIERLLLSLEKTRDDALQTIQPMLLEAHHWLNSKPYNFFAKTMFPTLDIVQNLGFNDHIWLKYTDIRNQLIIIEDKLARDYFSESLMETLRKCIIRNDFSKSPDSNAYLKLSNRIRSIEFSILRTGEFPTPSIIDAVNLIRTTKFTTFPDWWKSDLPNLFKDHGYKNKKDSPGYFF